MKLLQVLLEVIKKDLEDRYAKKYEGSLTDDQYASLMAVAEINANYGEWLFNRVLDDEIIKPKEIVDYIEYFKTFNKNKDRYPSKDIKFYKTQDQVQKFVDASETFSISKTAAKSGKVDSDKFEKFKIGTVDGFTVYEIPQGGKDEKGRDLHPVACALGHDTEWCTSNRSRDKFDEYTKDESLYIFVKGDEKYQIGLYSGQYMDSNNDDVDESDYNLDFFDFLMKRPEAVQQAKKGVDAENDMLYPILKSLDDNYKRKFMDNAARKMKGIPESEVENLSDELKKYYLDKSTKALDYDDELFELHSGFFKKRYLDRHIELGIVLPDSKFKILADNLRNYYIGMVLYNDGILSNYQFEWCSDDLKKQYIDKRVEDGWGIPGESKFLKASDDVKKYFIERMVDKGWADNLTPVVKDYYEKNMKGKLAEDYSTDISTIKKQGFDIIEEFQTSNKLYKMFLADMDETYFVGLTSNIGGEYSGFEDPKDQIKKPTDKSMGASKEAFLELVEKLKGWLKSGYKPLNIGTYNEERLNKYYVLLGRYFDVKKQDRMYFVITGVKSQVKEGMSLYKRITSK